MCLPSFEYHLGEPSFVRKFYCETTCCRTAGSADRPAEHEGCFASHFLNLLWWPEIFSPSRQSGRCFEMRVREGTDARRHVPTSLAIHQPQPLSFAARHRMRPCLVCLRLGWELAPAPALARLPRGQECPGQQVPWTFWYRWQQTWLLVRT